MATSSFPSIYTGALVQWREVKRCQGCQDRSIEVEKWIQRGEERVPAIQSEDFVLDSYLHRLDIKKARFGPHRFNISHKIGIFVEHIDNHSRCYNYEITRIPCLYKDIDNEKSPPSKEDSYYHVCKGHFKKIGCFLLKNDAEREGELKVKEWIEKANIKEAKFYLLRKDSPEAKFKKLFSTFVEQLQNYALCLVYYHHPLSLKCPDHPLAQKNS